MEYDLDKIKFKLEILINDLKLSKEKEKKDGKSYFNSDLALIRVIEIYKLLQ